MAYSLENILILVSGALFIAFICSLIFGWMTLGSKDEEIEKLKASYQKVMRSFNDLDEQAKLIVRT
jgi:hypothetical protein